MSPETRQQLIALVLGIVFIAGFILFAQRLGQFLRSRQQRDRIAAEKVTPSPAAAVAGDFAISPTPMTTRPDVTIPGKQPTMIPATGVETSVLTSLLAFLGLGMLLRKARLG